MGWLNCLSFCIWCPLVAMRLKELGPLDGQAEIYLLGGLRAKPHGVLGHAKAR